MKPQHYHDDQLRWSGTNKTWYVRKDPSIKRSLSTCARLRMNTESSMIHVLMTSQLDFETTDYHGGEIVTAGDEAWDSTVRNTLNILFDPTAFDLAVAGAEVEMFKKTIDFAIVKYLAAISTKRRTAISDGTYRLGNK